MGDQYDLIILDPPAFAKHRDALRNALRGYTKLNAKAFEKIRPGGILFTSLVRKLSIRRISGMQYLLLRLRVVVVCAFFIS